MRGSYIITASLIEYPIFKVGVKDWFKKSKSIRYAGNTERENLVPFLDKHKPHIFYLYTCESLTNLEILSNELKPYMNKMQVAVFLTDTDPEMIRRYIIQGVRGLLLNSIEHPEFLYATKVISEKGMFVSKEISSLVYDTVFINQADNMAEKSRSHNLTARESQVMMLLYKELSKYEIGRALNISPRTVDAHKNNIFKKLNIKNNVGLAKFIIENRLHLNASAMVPTFA